LTLALKHIDGTDASVSNPLYFKIGDSWRAVTAALSLSISAGAASFAHGTELAAKEVDYFPYVSWRAASSAVVLGFSRLPYATLYSDFSATANTQNYAPFSTAPAGTDDVVNIGRFTALNSGTASYNWSVPTFNSSNLIHKPCFETRWLSTGSTWGGFTATVPNGAFTYKLNMEVMIIVYIPSAPGASNNTTMTFTMPFKSYATLPAYLTHVADNSTNLSTPGHLQFTAGSATVSAWKTFYQGAWTNTGNKDLYCTPFSLRIN
jgi:hypothetical protein